MKEQFEDMAEVRQMATGTRDLQGVETEIALEQLTKDVMQKYFAVSVQIIGRIGCCRRRMA